MFATGADHRTTTNGTPTIGVAGAVDELNPRQREAAIHEGGPLLVIAGAGSGKTRTLAARVAWLIDRGVPPDRILLLTFTRRAAAEMVRRAGVSSPIVAGGGSGAVWGGTFHSVANRLLRHHADSVGLDPGYTVLDQTDGEAMFGLVRTETGVATTATRFPRKETVAAVYSRTVNEQRKLDEVLRTRFPWCREHADGIRTVVAAYRERKRRSHVLDYDDLLLYWKALLDGPAGDTVRQRFDHVLVDEFQDTNPIQGDILRRLCGPTGNLTVVGDDAQAIYSFRAATIDNIRHYPDDYRDVTVVTLEENYRSTPQILTAANAVIDASTELYPKRLHTGRGDGSRPRLVTCLDEAAQADHVCDRVLAHREDGIDLRHQAVLFRTGHHSDGLELELARRGIPFVKYGGLRFLEAAHVKDVLALLRIADNPHDELAWHRVLLAIPGVGPVAASRIFDAVRTAPEGIAGFLDLRPTVAAEATEPLAELRSALGDLTATGEGELPPGGQIDRLLPFCRMVFPARYDDATVRLGDIEHLGALASGYSTRSRFLTEITLDPPVSTTDLAGPPHLDDDHLVLSTIHSAKGGEWRAVFLIHAADGAIPSDMALGEPGGAEEERRLLYVAMTRARDHLDICFPQRFYHRRFSGDDRHSYAPLSRFLDPVRDHFEEQAAGGTGSGIGDPGGDREAPPGADPVTDLLDDLFA